MAQHDIPLVPIVGTMARSEDMYWRVPVPQPENDPASNKVRRPIVQEKEDEARLIASQYTDPVR